jgi:hypothetical protein
VDLERKRSPVVAGAGVVGQPGPVRRADVSQDRARLFHDLGHPEAATDLDRLAASNQHLAPVGQGSDDQQDGCRVVVDDNRGLGSTELSKERADVALARTALACRQIKLEVCGSSELSVGDRSAAEIRVQEHTGGIDDRLQQGASEQVGFSVGLMPATCGDQPTTEIDQQRMRQSATCERTGEGVDRRRPFTRTARHSRCNGHRWLGLAHHYDVTQRQANETQRNQNRRQ